ncbi:MAG: 50S ribosomal protein L29 [Bdellovibrionales bacterium]|nr:50S ribosomal protein L29 [Bdellovibrionales bacterium]NQZ17687.1 50S ribosomal protein L29 [Bdellovibrionales bacterium]
MKFEDIKDLNIVELQKKIRETKEKMFEARMKNAMGQMTNPISIREMRRDIAKLRTAMTANTKAN